MDQGGRNTPQLFPDKNTFYTDVCTVRHNEHCHVAPAEWYIELAGKNGKRLLTE